MIDNRIHILEKAIVDIVDLMSDIVADYTLILSGHEPKIDISILEKRLLEIKSRK